eukprot:gene1049-1001_t
MVAEKFNQDLPDNPLFESLLPKGRHSANRQLMRGNSRAFTREVQRPISRPSSRPLDTHKTAGELTTHRSSVTTGLLIAGDLESIKEDGLKKWIPHEHQVPSYHRSKRIGWEIEEARIANARELRQLQRWGRALRSYNRLPAKERRNTPAPAVCCPKCSEMVPVLLCTPTEYVSLLQQCPSGMPGRMQQPEERTAQEEGIEAAMLECDVKLDDFGTSMADLGLDEIDEDPIELVPFDDNMTADELYKACEDMQEKYQETHNMLKETRAELKDNIEDKEDAQEFAKYTDAQNKMDKIIAKESQDRDRLNTTKEDRDHREFQVLDTRKTLKTKIERTQQIMENMDLLKKNDDALDEQRWWFMHWYAYTKVNVALSKSAQEFLAMKKTVEVFTHEKDLMDEKIQNLEAQIESLKNKCYSAGSKILASNFGGLEGRSLIFKAMRRLDEGLEQQKKDAYVEFLENENETLKKTVQEKDEIISLRDAYISKLEKYITHLEWEKENKAMVLEDERMHLCDRMRDARIKHVDETIIVEREMAAKTQKLMRKNFRKERKQFNNEIATLQQVIQDAADLGNDPFATFKKRVVPPDCGSICIKCFQQILEKDVRVLPTDANAVENLRDENLVGDLADKFFAKDMFNMLTHEEKSAAALQFHTFMNQLSRPGTRPGNRARSPSPTSSFGCSISPNGSRLHSPMDRSRLHSPMERIHTAMSGGTWSDSNRLGTANSTLRLGTAGSRIGTAASIYSNPGFHNLSKTTKAPWSNARKAKSMSPPRKSLWATAGINASPPRRGRNSNDRIDDNSPRSPRRNHQMQGVWRPPRS